jgi:hypothetical protein
MVDRYTKIVLTVIATSLVALVLQNFIRPTLAQISEQCGGSKEPCWVQSAPSHPVYVASNAREPLYVISNPKLGFYVSTAPQEPLEVRVVH